MHPMDTWKTRLQAEFSRAQAARSRGNEGQARVCARRGAGIAVREYFSRQGKPSPAASVMDLFQELSLDPSIPPGSREIIEHLTLRVDQSFQLPQGLDLVEEARRLCETLLPDWQAED